MIDLYVKPKAVVLLSGGLDSATAMAVALDQGYDVHSLHVQYGQRHIVESKAAKKLCGRVFPLTTVLVMFNQPIQGSALTDNTVAVPKDRDEAGMSSVIPVSYVPARNTFLLGLAASLAEQIGAKKIFVGFNAVDYSGYPDCRPEFVAAFNQTLILGMKHSAEVVAPVISMSKAEIILLATKLGVPLQHTWSCYDPQERDPVGKTGTLTPCLKCDSCVIRASAFAKLGIKDPALAVQ